MSKDVSRRKMLSMLGLGAALGLALSGALEPLEAEAQGPLRPLRPPPHPLQPGRTGCNEGQRDAPLAISDGTRAAPVNLRPPRQLQRNSGPTDYPRTLTARFDEHVACSFLRSQEQ